MNILSFMWKNFNSESNPMGKRPYGVFIALFTLLGFGQQLKDLTNIAIDRLDF